MGDAMKTYLLEVSEVITEEDGTNTAVKTGRAITIDAEDEKDLFNFLKMKNAKVTISNLRVCQDHQKS